MCAQMIQISEKNIALNSSATTKEEALATIGTLLHQNDFTTDAYTQSLLKREEIANTFLGHLIAIPHGMVDDKKDVLQTGIVILQIPAGVDWGDGETVKIVIGIAAKTDEHINILSNLTLLLNQKELIEELATTSEKSLFLKTFNDIQSLNKPSSQIPLHQFDISTTVTIGNEHGLHARPATQFITLAQSFTADVFVEANGRIVNGKSLAELLKLGATNGTEINIHAKGEDAHKALTQLEKAVKEKLGETEPVPAKEIIQHEWTPQNVEKTFFAAAASPGLAVGKSFLFSSQTINYDETGTDYNQELYNLNQALSAAAESLQELYNQVRYRTGATDAAIFQAHQAFLADPDILAEVKELLLIGKSAAFAWHKTIEKRVEALKESPDRHLAARALDLKDVGRRVLKFIAGHHEQDFQFPDHPVILLAEDLTPSDTASLDPQMILGLCSAAGGPTSHSAIIARSLDIPSLVGVGPTLLDIPNGTDLILDGTNGALYISSSQEDLDQAQTVLASLSKQRKIEFEQRFEPALTTDGTRITIGANIGNTKDARKAIDAGAESVGLMRTEFLFLDRQAPPTEDEQYEHYKEMAESLHGLPLILRTLDIGGDKNVPYINLPKEQNPFLGERGIRLCLNRPELFLIQLKAIFRASLYGNVQIMFPMISTLEELIQARTLAETARIEIGAPRVKIGMMVEVPSVVAMAEEFAANVDFFSIGTNDLTQYMLAIDRVHPTLASKADSLHPAVLRMIAKVVEASQKENIWTGVCGGLAGDPLGAAILAGLGVRELSMVVPSIAAVKSKLRSISLKQAQDLAMSALMCENSSQVRKLDFPKEGSLQ